MGQRESLGTRRLEFPTRVRAGDGSGLRVPHVRRRRTAHPLRSLRTPRPGQQKLQVRKPLQHEPHPRPHTRRAAQGNPRGRPRTRTHRSGKTQLAVSASAAGPYNFPRFPPSVSQVPFRTPLRVAQGTVRRNLPSLPVRRLRLIRKVSDLKLQPIS